MGELAAPILVHADSLTFDDDAGTLSANLLADASHETPSLALDQVIAILRPSSSSAQPRFNIVVGLVEDSAAAAAAAASAAEQQPFRLIAIQTSADDIPPQLASSVPRIAQLPAHLARGADGGGVVVDYVLSTKAGAGRAMLFWETALQPLLRVAAQAFSENTVPDRLVVTNSDDSVREYAREKRPAGVPRTIVLLSGDGGVVDLLNSSAPPSNEDSNNGTSSPPPPPPLPTIVLVPLGTGNALFNSLHKPLFTGPSELVLALRTLLNGVAAPLPTFRASFPPGSRIVKYANKDAAAAEEETTPPDVAAAEAQLFRQETHVDTLHGSIVASYGFHASIVYESDTPAYRAHGAARFGMVAQELLKTSHPYAAQLAVRRRRRLRHHHPNNESGGDDGDGNGDGDGDGGRLEKIPRATHAYVLGALVSNLERTFTISPASRPLDGQLRLVHFAPLGPARTMEAMMKAYDGGKHVEAAWDDEDGERVYYEDVDEFAVTVQDEEERWRKVCIDGTIVDIPRGGTVHVQREEKGLFHIVVDSSVL